MTRFVALFLVFATPSFALSCLPPDAVRLYVQAAESEEFFAIVIGRLHPAGEIDIPDIPRDGTIPEDREATTRVRMTGRVLGPESFDTAFDRLIDVKVTCFGMWCGGPVTDRDILGALRLTGNVSELEIGPCGGLSMPAEQADLDALLRCHKLGNCSAK